MRPLCPFALFLVAFGAWAAWPAVAQEAAAQEASAQEASAQEASAQGASAQEAVAQPASAPLLEDVNVQRGEPGPSTTLVFTVADAGGAFERLASQRLTRLADDTGRDLFARHRRRAAEGRGDTTSALVRAEGMEGGFRLVVAVQAVPARAAQSLRLGGAVEYIANTAQRHTTRLDGIVAEDEPVLGFAEATLSAEPAGMSAGEKTYYRFASPLSVECIALSGEDGRAVGASSMRMNGAVVAALSEDEANEPLTVVVEYLRPEQRRLTFDERVYLGPPARPAFRPPLSPEDGP